MRGGAVALGLTVAAVGTFLWLFDYRDGVLEVGDQGSRDVSHPLTTVWVLGVTASLLIVAARFLGRVALMLGQPRIIGEIVTGLAVVPLLRYVLAPDLVLGSVVSQITALGTIGLVLYVFTAGWDVDDSFLRRWGPTIIPVSMAVFFVPFVVGAMVSIPFETVLAGSSADRSSFVLFMGCAIGVTALPVLARILAETGLTGSRVGRLAIVCAGGCDFIAWSLLAFPLALAAHGSLADATIPLTVAAVLVVVLVLARPLIRRAWVRADASASWTATTHALLFVAVVVSCAATSELLGLHAIFGAFFAGLLTPRHLPRLATAAGRVNDVNMKTLLPLYFGGIGLQLDLSLIAGAADFMAAGSALLAVAVATKFLTGGAIGVALNLSTRESAALGVLLNTRGVTEIAVLSAGMSSGLISSTCFLVMGSVAMATTVATAPLATALMGRRPQSDAEPREALRSPPDPG